MIKKKKGSVAPPVAAPAAEIQKISKVPYVAPVYPYIPSRKEKRDYVHARLKGEPIWVKEPQLSPTMCPFTPRAEIKPPPELQPLLFNNPQASPNDSTDKAPSHALWWAHISNSLASLSARSYHLFVASNFLNCKSEELLLLYEVRKLNADGKALFEDVVRGLRARQLNWDFLGGCEGIDELRISWDMMAKGEMVGRYDDFVGEQVGREIRGVVDIGYEDDAKTVVSSHARHDDCAIEDSTSEDSPSETSPPDETDAPRGDGDKTIIVVAEQHDSHAIADPQVEESPTSAPLLNWADEVNESCQEDCKTLVDERKVDEDSTASDTPVPEALTDVSTPAPTEASSPTWAEVVASPTKIMNCGTKCVGNWGAVSGKSWAWERNWR